MRKLPFLLSIPHGGTAIPEELKTRICLSRKELLIDGDPYTGEIYDMGSDVEMQLKFDIARALIDVNRAPDDLPPSNPDGILKTVSIFNNPVYQKGLEADADESGLLLAKYYAPYHAAIQESLKNKEILFAFDCHSMEAVGPPVARDAGRKRPLFCLGNNMGNACSDKQTRLFVDCICKAFEVPRQEITINEPFAGGYITRQYGMSPVPWIQIEMNRSLYLHEQLSRNEKDGSEEDAIKRLNSGFRQTLFLFADMIG